MKITIRRTREDEFRETEVLTRETFWDVYKPGSDEHLVLHKLRIGEDYIGDLDLVLFAGKKLIGHIICSKARVKDSMNEEHTVLCAGPFSIMKGYQKKGYGSLLMEYCIESAIESGYAGMILFGDPGYYHRFGFVNAEKFGIQTSEGMNFEPFMARELKPGGLQNIRGKFYEDKSFTTDEEELNSFEKQFSFKEKHITPTQLKF